MEKDTNISNSLIEQVTPLLNESISPSRTQSIVRRFIQAKVSNHSQDIALLNQMGFDEGMVKKVYLFLKPHNINEAIEMMTEVDGIYQHDFYESRAHWHLCFICKRERENHRDYTQGAMGVSKTKNYVNRIIDSIMNNDEDSKSGNDNIEDHMITLEECRICYEKINNSEGVTLKCTHFCCWNCMFYYIKTEIESPTVFKLKCFERGCNTELDEDFVEFQIKNDKDLIKKFDAFKVRAKIYLSNDKKFCPEPDCNSYLQEGKDKYVQCENGHKYCYICLKPWHNDTPCDEELDKDFQIWKKDKVVKQCPRCKIYTEKNEGCNHMTCTECKYQWCWLCEGEYQEGHFRRGQCNGLQFVKINYLSERPKHVRIYNDAHPPAFRERHHNQEDRQEGCCICNRNILNRYWFIHSIGPLNWYYGNKIITFIISLLTVLFLLVPVVAVALIYDVGDVYFESFTSMHNFFIILISISLFICYQFSVTCITFLVLIISLPIPEKSLNLARFIWEKGKNHWIFTVY